MTPFRIQIGGYDVGDAPTPWCIIAELNGAERHADRGIKRLFRGVFIDWEKLSLDVPTHRTWHLSGGVDRIEHVPKLRTWPWRRLLV